MVKMSVKKRKMSTTPSKQSSQVAIKTVEPASSTTPSSYSFNYNWKWVFSSQQQLVNLSTLEKDQIREILKGIDVIVTDCDGVLWVDNEAILGSVEVINKFKELGKKVIFLTNNSTKTREHFAIKAKRLGFQIEKQDIVSTASLIVSYLKNKVFQKKVYLIGSVGLAQEIEQAGIRHLGIGPDVIQKNLLDTLDAFHADPDVGAVVVGFDEHFSYIKLLRAASYLNKPSCIFLATTKDEGFSVNSAIEVPGTGAILKSVEAVSQKEAIVIGKPNLYVVEALMSQYGIDPMRSLLIGDSCKTDITLGTRSGFQTLLVLSGLTKLEEVEAWKNSSNVDEHDLVPDYYIEKLGDLLELIS